MRIASSHRQCGLTLIEVTLVITVLLGLVSVLFIGFNSYKKGVNRATCIQSVSTVQRAMRAHCNMYDLNPGQSAPNLKGRIIGPGLYVPETPMCPSGGIYTYWEGTVPASSTAMMQCSILDHVPLSTNAW